MFKLRASVSTASNYEWIVCKGIVRWLWVDLAFESVTRPLPHYKAVFRILMFPLGPRDSNWPCGFTKSVDSFLNHWILNLIIHIFTYWLHPSSRSHEIPPCLVGWLLGWLACGRFPGWLGWLVDWLGCLSKLGTGTRRETFILIVFSVISVIGIRKPLF